MRIAYANLAEHVKLRGHMMEKEIGEVVTPGVTLTWQGLLLEARYEDRCILIGPGMIKWMVPANDEPEPSRLVGKRARRAGGGRPSGAESDSEAPGDALAAATPVP